MLELEGVEDAACKVDDMEATGRSGWCEGRGDNSSTAENDGGSLSSSAGVDTLGSVAVAKTLKDYGIIVSREAPSGITDYINWITVL